MQFKFFFLHFSCLKRFWIFQVSIVLNPCLKRLCTFQVFYVWNPCLKRLCIFSSFLCLESLSEKSLYFSSFLCLKSLSEKTLHFSSFLSGILAWKDLVLFQVFSVWNLTIKSLSKKTLKFSNFLSEIPVWKDFVFFKSSQCETRLKDFEYSSFLCLKWPWLFSKNHRLENFLRAILPLRKCSVNDFKICTFCFVQNSGVKRRLIHSLIEKLWIFRNFPA